MKTRSSALFFVLLCTFCIKAQLNLKHNGIRIGDEIIKQQVEYKAPGESGYNCIWDFSQLKTINESYTLTYSLPPIQGDSLYIMGDSYFDVKKVGEGELIVGTEHNTMYYYRQVNDSLILLGHENPSVRLCYTQPILEVIYPMIYGQNFTNNYKSKALYSGTVGLQTEGSINVKVDAFGKMVLPTGDTLDNVLRIKVSQQIKNVQKNNANIDEGTQLDIYKWFTKGYRYPIFETVKSINVSDSSEIFSTAFFYPLQDHFYLDKDPENLAILDSLWNVRKEMKPVYSERLNKNTTKELWYKIYPNPVKDNVYIEYDGLYQDVTILLYTIDGKLIKKIENKSTSGSSYKEQIDCSSLPAGNYIIKLSFDKEVMSEKIIKK